MLRDLTLLAGRLLMAGLFVWESWWIATHPTTTIAFMEAFGVPGALMPLAVLVQAVGGVAVAVGLGTRVAAAALAGYSVVTALIFHLDFGDADQIVHFGKNAAIAGGFLFVVVTGAGRFSIDGLRRRTGAGSLAGPRPMG